jgi:predicted metal-binding protein
LDVLNWDKIIIQLSFLTKCIIPRIITKAGDLAIEMLPGNKEAHLAQIIKMPKRCGFDDVKFINAPKIILAQWPRTWCQAHCPQAGENPTTPPISPALDEMITLLSEYRFGLLVRKDVKSKKLRSEQYTAFSEKLIDLEKQLRGIGYLKAFCLAASSCLFAPADEPEERPCDYTGKCRPTLEAACIDIEQTLDQMGMEEMVEDFKSGLNHLFGIILVK